MFWTVIVVAIQKSSHIPTTNVKSKTIPYKIKYWWKIYFGGLADFSANANIKPAINFGQRDMLTSSGSWISYLVAK